MHICCFSLSVPFESLLLFSIWCLWRFVLKNHAIRGGDFSVGWNARLKGWYGRRWEQEEAIWRGISFEATVSWYLPSFCPLRLFLFLLLRYWLGGLWSRTEPSCIWDAAVKPEFGDCVWYAMILRRNLNVDKYKEFLQIMNGVRQRRLVLVNWHHHCA